MTAGMSQFDSIAGCAPQLAVEGTAVGEAWCSLESAVVFRRRDSGGVCEL